MRALIQRVTRAEVRVDGQITGRIAAGILLLVGVGKGDTPETARALAEKVANLRIFDDGHGRMNRSIIEAGGSVLCVSQFTLYGDCRRGRRPSYDGAASPRDAEPLYEALIRSLRELLPGGANRVETGKFQARMDVELVNDGPVTLLVDSDRRF